MSVKRRNISGCSFCALYENNSVLPKHVHNNIVLLAVFSAHESTHWTTREHNTYCYWIPIMMHNPVAAQEYNTNMSGLWFGRNLHGYNSLSTGSRLSRARRLHCNDWPCAFDSLSSFCGSVSRLSIPSIPNLDPTICKSTQTCLAPHAAGNLTSTFSILSIPVILFL